VSKSVQTLATFPPPNSNNANNINESSNTLSTFCEQNDELFGVLKKSFFKHHPYIYSKEINATILVTDGPMECTQQPHMDYCWEMILCTSQQEACSNRTQLLRGNNNIPITGHLPLFSLMVLTFTCGLVQVLESLST